jgi:hypothetical protein
MGDAPPRAAPMAITGDNLFQMQLGAGDTLEANELESNGADLYYITPGHHQTAWPGVNMAEDFAKAMNGLTGDADVMHRHPQTPSLVVGVTNAGGTVVPYNSGGTAIKDCRLRYALTLIKQGILDMYAFTECHMCKSGAGRIRRYMREHDFKDVVAKMLARQ